VRVPIVVSQPPTAAAGAKACCFTVGHAHSLPRDRALEGVCFCPQPGGLPPESRNGPVFTWPWARRVRHLAPKQLMWESKGVAGPASSGGPGERRSGTE